MNGKEENGKQKRQEVYYILRAPSRASSLDLRVKEKGRRRRSKTTSQWGASRLWRPSILSTGIACSLMSDLRGAYLEKILDPCW